MASYAEQVAADVAARYGVAVGPAAVQIVPRGVSGEALPVWNGDTLIYAEPSRMSWRAQTIAKARAARKNPEHIEIRRVIAMWHAQGKSDSEIAAAMALDVVKVRYHRGEIGLSANPDQRRVIEAAELLDRRIAQIRARYAAGWGCAAIAADLELSVDYVRRMARGAGIVFVRNSKPKQQPVKTAKTAAAPRVRPAATLPRPVGRPRKPVVESPAVLSKTAQRRADLAALIAALDHPLVLADLIGFGQQLQVSRRSLHNDVMALGLVWPQRPAKPERPAKALRAAAAAKAKCIPRAERHAAMVARQDRLRAMDLTDITPGQLADMLGITLQTLRSDLKTVGKSCKAPVPMMSPAQRVVFDAHQAKIAALAAEGKSRSEIQLATGLSSNALGRHLRVAGIALAGKPRNCWATRPRGITPATRKFRQVLAKMRADGATYAQITAATGRKSATISEHLSAMGLTGPQGTQGKRQVAA